MTSIVGALSAARTERALVHVEGRNFKIEGQNTASAGVPWRTAAEAFWRTQGAVLVWSMSGSNGFV